MTVNAQHTPGEDIEVVVARDASGWAHSLFNCTTGSNYLRTGEYYDLIRTLDNYATESANLKATNADLLAALQAYVHAVAVGGGDTRASVMAAIREADNHARAAIAKATS